MTIDKPLPPASSSDARVDIKTGRPSSQHRRWEESIASTVRKLVDSANTAETVSLPCLIEFPSDKDYKILVKCPFAWTITGVTTITTAGTATVTCKINSTALGGTANSASTSEQSQAHSSSNAVSEGDDIVLTVSSTSSCEGLSVNVTGTYP